MLDDSMGGTPLSPQQKRVLEAGEGLPHPLLVVSLGEELRGDLLAAAWQRAVGRFEILRTTFGRSPATGEWEQSPGPALAPLAELDLRSLPPAAQKERLEEVLEADRRTPFDLAAGSPCRCRWVRLASDQSLLALCLPALATDGAGLEILLEAWGGEYQALLDGRETRGETLQYPDFARWQSQLLTDEEGLAGRAFWRDQLGSPVPGLELPLATERPEGLPFAPRRLALDLAPDLLACAEGAAARQGLSAGTFWLGCWGLLLARLSGQGDLLLAMACDGRPYEELRDAPGLMARQLPLRLRFSPADPVGAVLASLESLREEAESWQEHFAWPAASAPLAAGFELRKRPALSFGGRRLEVERREAWLEPFEVRLAAQDGGEGAGWRFDLEYDPAVLPQPVAESLARSFGALLASVAEGIEAPVETLDLLAPADRHRLLVDINRTTTPFEGEVGIHHLFERQARRWPERTAVVCEGESLTYGQLERRADALAASLVAAGVGPEVPVGLCCRRSVDAVVGLLGILKAGGAFVPLEPDSPDARLRLQLEEARVPVLVLEEGLGERFAGVAGRVCLPRTDPAGPVERPAIPFDSRSLAYVMFTSGSTGVPKGVGVSHRNLVNYVEHIVRTLGLGDGERAPWHFATVSTLAADLGNTALFPALASGDVIHLVSYERSTDAAAFAAYMSRYPVDVLKIVPSHLRALLPSAGQGALPRRALFLGGEELGADLAREIRGLAPGLALYNHYGPTETTVGCMTFPVDEVPAGLAAIPVGRPIANARVHVLDSRLEPVFPGVAGEIFVGGEGVSRGYVERPETTAERFIPDPFDAEPGGRLYRTGDRACLLSGGEVLFRGRTDHQLKIRGYRVEPGEVENVLRGCPGVRGAAIAVQEDAPGRKRMVAFVEAAEGSGLTPEALRELLAARLAEPMIPGGVVFVDALPLTRNGKVDRAALGRLATAPESDHAEPRTPLEQILVRVFRRVLGNERIGIHDNFFELGGDSILSIQIGAHARKEGCRVTFKQIFEHPTVAELARVAEAVGDLQAEQGLVLGEAPLVPAQQRFFSTVASGHGHYNMSLLLELRRPLPHLAHAVERLLGQHDALRLGFARDGEGGWRQRFAGLPAEPPVIAIDLAELTAARQREALEAAAGLLQGSLDLADGPVARFASFDLGPERPGRLLIVVHHLAMDVVSWRVLLEDLQTACRQLEAGRPVALPDKTTSFKEWAERLVERSRSEEMREELPYWLRRSRIPVRPLPRDGGQGPATEGAARTLSVELAEDETRALLEEVVPARQAQIHEILLAATASSVARWTGGRSVAVEMEGHGREDLFDDVDLSRTVGWFTSHFPLVLDLGRSVTPLDELESVKEQHRQVPGRGLGFGLLRFLDEEAGAGAEVGGLAAPEVGFNFVGHLEQALPETDLFAPAAEPTGAERSPHAARANLLGVVGDVALGRLRMHWVYDERIHRRATIEALAAGALAWLRALAEESRGAERRYSTVDFPDAGLDQDELDSILAQVSR